MLTAAALLALAATSIAAGAAPTAATVKPNRVTIKCIDLGNHKMRITGKAFRNGNPAANVTVTIRAGKTRTSLKPLATDQTDSRGRYSYSFEITEEMVNADGWIYLRATTTFAKSLICSCHLGF